MSGNYFPQPGTHIPNTSPPDVYLRLKLPHILLQCYSCPKVWFKQTSSMKIHQIFIPSREFSSPIEAPPWHAVHGSQLANLSYLP